MKILDSVDSTIPEICYNLVQAFSLGFRMRVTVYFLFFALLCSCNDASDEFNQSNLAPVAIAGEDIDGIVLQSVILDGSGSYDPEGAGLEYLWNIISQPNGGNLQSLPGVERPGFTPIVAGDYEFSLVVDDGVKLSEADNVIAHISANPPQCTGDVVCGAEMYCDVANNVCLPRLPSGSLCNFNAQCLSNSCSANVCQ